MRQRINQIAKETGIPLKKILDFLFLLRSGQSVENNQLVQKTGISKNALNQVKGLLASALMPPSKNTQLAEKAVKKTAALFGADYKPEEALWTFLEDEHYRKSVKLLKKYADQRPTPARKYDQFTATVETTAKRASLLNFFEEVKDQRLLFLGDNDFTSVVVANLGTALRITVLDIDKRVLAGIGSIAKDENLRIELAEYDARKPLLPSCQGAFDLVFTDPPYTPEGIKLFLSRAIQALDPANQSARVYICYGNSDRAKERFLPIYKALAESGLMVRWVLDKFNRYHGAQSIGSASSLLIGEVTPQTKPLIRGDYDKKIYTHN